MGEGARIAFVALGSNVGDSKRIIGEAFGELQKLSSEPVVRSSLWRTSPVDCPPGSPDFVNAVARITPLPSHGPEMLLQKLQEIERQFGRRPKKVLNEPRPLDLDLLAIGDCEWESPELILPHPRAHLRQFVLAPWNEIAPGFVMAGLNRTVAELLEGLATEEKIERLD